MISSLLSRSCECWKARSIHPIDFRRPVSKILTPSEKLSKPAMKIYNPNSYHPGDYFFKSGPISDSCSSSRVTTDGLSLHAPNLERKVRGRVELTDSYSFSRDTFKQGGVEEWNILGFEERGRMSPALI